MLVGERPRVDHLASVRHGGTGASAWGAAWHSRAIIPCISTVKKPLKEQLDPFENDGSSYVMRLLYAKARCFPLFSQDYFTHA